MDFGWVPQEEGSHHLTLSGGEARLQALRAAFAAPAGILLLDEPSNDLDRHARAWLQRELRSYAGTVLAVTHDPEILDLVDEIWELHNGSLRRHPPGYEAYMDRLRVEEESLEEALRSYEAERQRREDQARTSVERQQKRMVRGEKQGRRENMPRIVRGAKKRQAQRSLARVERVHERILDSQHERVHAQKRRLRQLSLFRWDARASRAPDDRSVLRVEAAALDLTLQGPERVHLAGRNGAGKSMLLRALMGDAEARSRCHLRAHLGVPAALLDQRLGTQGGMRPLWQVFQERAALPLAEARTLLGRLGFEQSEQERPCDGLSGGERMRLELALVLARHPAPQLLLLDEPSNHLDPEARRILVNFLRGFPGALLVVSHDERFLAEIGIGRRANLGPP